MTLFSRVKTAASLWLHLLAGNLFAAKSVYLEGAGPCSMQKLAGSHRARPFICQHCCPALFRWCCLVLGAKMFAAKTTYLEDAGLDPLSMPAGMALCSSHATASGSWSDPLRCFPSATVSHPIWMVLSAPLYVERNSHQHMCLQRPPEMHKNACASPHIVAPITASLTNAGSTW